MKLIIKTVHSGAPPIRLKNPTFSPISIVKDPAQTRSGAKIPLSVACAEIEKIMQTIKARIFPVPAKTIRRDMHPLVNTIPVPNISPPIAIANNGNFASKKRWLSNEIISK